MAYLPPSQEQTTMHVFVHGVQKEVRLVYKPDGSPLEDVNANGYIYEASDGQRVTLRFVAQDSQAENIPPVTRPPTPACASDGFDGVGPGAFPTASASAEETSEIWSTRKTKFFISKYTEMKNLVGKSRELRYVAFYVSFDVATNIMSNNEVYCRFSNLYFQQCQWNVFMHTLQDLFKLSTSILISRVFEMCGSQYANMISEYQKAPHLSTKGTAKFQSHVAVCFVFNLLCFHFSTRKLLWVRLTELINKEFMCNMTSTQIENKWKSLDRAYKRSKKENSSSGHHRVTCEYEEELSEILEKEHSINPRLLLEPGKAILPSGCSGTSTTEASAELLPVPVEDRLSATVEDSPASKRKRHRKSQLTPLLEVLEKMGQAREKQAEARAEEQKERKKWEEERAKRHADRMERFDRLLDLIAKQQGSQQEE
ncbi:uncharacterized protein [Dermacentor andersoni]|uniref:uncharacterized protein isoform X1 n=1 Tax=Dermacentor andersoni TaxID=34620 RepID=UPI002417BAB7|nr:uncharacterized protein LOC126536005 isoform X1 [Dermacentor andersoni]XP_054933780.1 uncharacterized protein LOC126519981 isoform X1 [Dermacentor andersoni]